MNFYKDEAMKITSQYGTKKSAIKEVSTRNI
jgi:hypothetical protein